VKLQHAYLCLACDEVYRPPSTPLARRACPGCDGEQITPLSGLLSRWYPVWRGQREETTA